MYQYWSDGTKKRGRDSDGDGHRYAGSFSHEADCGEDTGCFSVAWDEGRTYVSYSGAVSDRWFVRDHLGNVRAVVDLSAPANADVDDVIVEQNDYLPFGTKAVRPTLATSSDNLYRYAGKEEQTLDYLETGLLDFGARYYDPWSCQWTAVDPLAEKYSGMSPYGYCAGDPVNLVDPDGKDWYYSDDASIQWTDFKSQEELNKNKISGRYLGARVVTFNGSYSEKLGKGDNIYGEGAVAASVDVYGENGAEDIGHYTGFTLTSDFEKFGAIADGEYDVTYHPSERTINGSAKIPKVYAVNDGQEVDCVNGVNPSPKEYNPCNSTHKNGIYVHRTNNDGFAGDRPQSNSCVSSGCLLIGAKDWNAFCKQIGKHGFKLILSRK